MNTNGGSYHVEIDITSTSKSSIKVLLFLVLGVTAGVKEARRLELRAMLLVLQFIVFMFSMINVDVMKLLLKNILMLFVVKWMKDYFLWLSTLFIIFQRLYLPTGGSDPIFEKWVIEKYKYNVFSITTLIVMDQFTILKFEKVFNLWYFRYLLLTCVLLLSKQKRNRLLIIRPFNVGDSLQSYSFCCVVFFISLVVIDHFVSMFPVLEAVKSK